MPTSLMVVGEPTSKVPLTPAILKLATDKTLSTSESLVRTLPEVVFASSRMVKLSAFKIDGSSCAVTVMVAV